MKKPEDGSVTWHSPTSFTIHTPNMTKEEYQKMCDGFEKNMKLIGVVRFVNGRYVSRSFIDDPISDRDN